MGSKKLRCSLFSLSLSFGEYLLQVAPEKEKPFSFQVPIFGESECQANVEENGSNFAQGMLCAGGTNQQGSCPVNREANILKD